MPAEQSSADVFLSLFAKGDVEGATALLNRHTELADHGDYKAHPLLRSFVDRNDGHCYKDSHMCIADLLTPESIRGFRDAILKQRLEDVRAKLQADPKLIHSEFTAGRGIAQAIHHWQSVSIGKLLIEAGANIEVLTTRGESPLTMQLRFGSVDGVRFLLENGADANNGVGGHMPSKTMDQMIELLLVHGWDINNGQMLHDANHGYGKRVQTWLRHGADANLRNSSGQTPLHLCASRGSGRDVIRALVESGADIDAVDNNGHSALDLASDAAHNVAMHELIALGTKGS